MSLHGHKLHVDSGQAGLMQLHNIKGWGTIEKLLHTIVMVIAGEGLA